MNMRAESEDSLRAVAHDVLHDSEAPPEAGSRSVSWIVPRSQGWLLSGLSGAFFCFGFALGELAGFSVAQGISQLLLTSVFTFVGGALLSYAGFRKLAADGRAHPEPLRVAAAVAGLSLGLCLGLPAGVFARCNVHAQQFFLGERLAHSQCLAPATASPLGTPYVAPSSDPPVRPNGLGLQAGTTGSACHKALVELNSAATDPRRNRSEIPALVSTTINACQLDGS
jgi:hypothetical protein